mmetsp:Transcript_26851/g.52898  ORF Transcript_26851/g.52898 Transcript_26851/m.52898 type:complete len:568 (-) Transcript_26851:138-1841(-)
MAGAKEEEESSDQPLHQVQRATPVEEKCTLDRGLVWKGRQSKSRVQELPEEKGLSFNQRIYLKKETQLIRISASDVAAVCGLNPYKDISDVFMNYLYQDLTDLLRLDAKVLSLTVVTEEEAVDSLIVKTGEQQKLQGLKEDAMSDERVPTLLQARALSQQVSDIMKLAVADKKVSKSEAEDVCRFMISRVNTQFGTRNEDMVIKEYERRSGCSVFGTNEHIFFWPFPHNSADLKSLQQLELEEVQDQLRQHGSSAEAPTAIPQTQQLSQALQPGGSADLAATTPQAAEAAQNLQTPGAATSATPATAAAAAPTLDAKTEAAQTEAAPTTNAGQQAEHKATDSKEEKTEEEDEEDEAGGDELLVRDEDRDEGGEDRDEGEVESKAQGRTSLSALENTAWQHEAKALRRYTISVNECSHLANHLPAHFTDEDWTQGRAVCVLHIKYPGVHTSGCIPVCRPGQFHTQQDGRHTFTVLVPEEVVAKMGQLKIDFYFLPLPRLALDSQLQNTPQQQQQQQHQHQQQQQQQQCRWRRRWRGSNAARSARVGHFPSGCDGGVLRARPRRPRTGG